MTTYAKRKLKYSRNENFNLLHYVESDRIVTLAGATPGLIHTGRFFCPNSVEVVGKINGGER